MSSDQLNSGSISEQIPQEDPNLSGFEGYHPSKPMDFFSHFMVGWADTKSRYLNTANFIQRHPALNAIDKDFIQPAIDASTDIVNRLSSPNSQTVKGEPVVSDTQIKQLEEDNKGLKIQSGTPEWLANSLASAFQEKEYYGAFAKLGSPGLMGHVAAISGDLLGGATDIPADIAGGRAFELGGKALTFGFKKLMTQGFMTDLIGNAGVKNAIHIAHSSMQASLGAGGYNLATVPTEIMEAKEQGRPLKDLNILSDLASSMLIAAPFGAVGAALGVTGKSVMNKLFGLSENEKSALAKVYTLVTPDSHLASKLDGMGQMLSGKNAYVHHIYAEGKYDAGVVLRNHLTQNNISLDKVSNSLEDAQIETQKQYAKLADISGAPEDLAKKAEPLVEELKKNPSKDFSTPKMKESLKGILDNEELDHHAFSDFVPDKVNIRARLTQKDMYQDFKSGNLTRESLPKEVITKLQGEEKLKKSQNLLSRYQELFERTKKNKVSRKKYSHLISLNKNFIKSQEAKTFGFLSLDKEVENIKSTLTDENNKPISGWKKHPAMKRLNQLKVRKNEARNFYMQLHLDDEAQVNKQYLKARDKSMTHAVHTNTLLKGMYDQVADKNKPVSFDKVKDYTQHLLNPIVKDFNWPLPEELKKPIEENLTPEDMDIAKQKLESLGNEELKKQLDIAEAEEAQIPAYHSMAKQLMNCILGAIS